MPNDTENPQEEMVAVFSSSNHDAEMEALTVKGVLEANDVPAQVVGSQMLPNLEFQVQVPEELAAEAEAVLEEARAAGPSAAAEAEAWTEGRLPPE